MLNKLWFLFLRDARTALSYPMMFWPQWVAIPLGITGVWFVSKLIPPSDRFGVGGHVETYFTYVVLNVAFMGFQTASIQSFQNAVRGSQTMGVLEALLVTPTNLPVLVFGFSLWAFTLTSARTAVFLLSAMLIFHLNLNQANPAIILLSLTLIVACMSSFGILSAASVMTFKQPSPTSFLFGNVSGLLAGVAFPISVLPAWLQRISVWLPLTHALRAIRGGAHGASLSQTAPDLIWLACAALILLPASLLVFHRSVLRAKYDGTLGQY